MIRRHDIMAAVAGIFLLSGCQQRQATDDQPKSPATAVAVPAPEPPLVESKLDRGALLAAVAQVASDTALGKSDVDGQRPLDGRQFEVRLRFGCTGDDQHAAARGWTFDENRRKLTLNVEPDITAKSPLVKALGSRAFEAVEGFLIWRPWVLAAGCPAAPAIDPAAPPGARASHDAALPKEVERPPIAAQQIAIAQFYTETDARTHRRGKRGYTATKVLAEGMAPSTIGYDLVLSGRLRHLPDGRAITCINRLAGAPPDCVVSAELDSVAIEHPVTREKLADWVGA